MDAVPACQRGVISVVPARAMRRWTILIGAVLLAACSSRGNRYWLLDHEAFQRALSRDTKAQDVVGSDAEPKYSAKPGDKHYVTGRGRQGVRQLHMFSRRKFRTTVIDADALRKDTQIVVIARYGGAPPPDQGWAKFNSR